MNNLVSWIAVPMLVGLITVANSQADNSEFKVRIKEKGVRFTERIKVDVKKNTVTFIVPKHNDVARSEVLNDFNLNLTITRLPDAGACHIKPLDKHLPSPSEIMSDMNYVSLKYPPVRGRGMLVSSTEWAIDQKLKAKNLSPSVIKFCAGLSVFSLRKVDIDGVMVVERGTNDNDTITRRSLPEFTFCKTKPNYVNAKCDPDDWKIKCKFVPASSTCVYWVKCKLPVRKLKKNLKNCDFAHTWSAVICCYPTCP